MPSRYTWGAECAACGDEWNADDYPADKQLEEREKWDKRHDACFPKGVKDKVRG